ncbi:MAG: hypothetical protein IT437_01625 [Phycisphaerales bacterium]|nr:hypothetical protein [Phycisphaerales bacterium]
MPIPDAHAAPAGAAQPTLPEEFEPVAALLAVVFPGAGQWYLGDRARGVFAAVGVLGLFLGGLLIGGISVVDRKDNPIWFIGEALVGPVALGVDYVHQHHFKVIDPVTGRLRPANPDEARDPATGRAVKAGPGRGPPYVKALGRVAELGTLFATIAGMLNLIVILDAAWHSPRDPALGAGTPGGAR